MKGRKFLVLLSSAILVAIVGCGGEYDSSVSGVVTLNGSALSVGWVAYHPVSGGPAAYAPIEPDGKYIVRTGRATGLPSGQYQVTVTANEAPQQLKSADGRPMPTGKLITPEWYGLKDTSGLQVTVEPGDNEINLELTSQPPAGWNPSGRRSG